MQLIPLFLLIREPGDGMKRKSNVVGGGRRGRNHPESEVAQERSLGVSGGMSREGMADGRIARDLGRRKG